MAMRKKMPEVIFSSNSANGSCSWSVEDLHTGNVIQTSKVGQSSARTLCLAGQDYVVSAVPEQPIINVWHLSHPKREEKMIVPGIVTALAVSHQGFYLVAAIDRKLHLWQVSTGDLLQILTGHYQEVNCIKFTSDGCYFISGGADGMTLVWTVSSVLSSEIASSRTNDVIKPTFCWKNHTDGVKDIYVGYFGCKGRFITVSNDQTCKYYQLPPGILLRTFFMDVPLRSVSMDPAECFIFLGATDGNIYSITLSHCILSSEIHYNTSSEAFRIFRGHQAQVTCLSVSMDGLMLLSGSDDKCLKLWDIVLQTCIKTLQRDGPITNAFLRLIPPVLKNFQNKKYQVPTFQFESLKRQMRKNEENDSEDVLVPLNTRNQQLRTWGLASETNMLGNIELPGESDNSKVQLKGEIGSVKKMNKQMYCYLIQSFMDNMQK